jgi:glyoxylase-like metal-dependent hydrolase (beta-lactamase superfamily II)
VSSKVGAEVVPAARRRGRPGTALQRSALACVIVAAAASLSAMRSPQELSSAAVTATQIQRVRGNLYVITGADPTDRDAFSGGNTAVFVTAEGVTLVDTKLPHWGPTILQRIKSITDKPVIRIINTHTHNDHTGSNEFFPTTVDIVAHANTKTNMERMAEFEGPKAAFIAKRTFTDTMTIGTGNDRIDLLYFGAGHTNGDIFVLFPALRVVHTGDMFPMKDAPFLDRGNGGSGVAFSATLAKALARLSDVEVVIPGHSAVTTRADLDAYQRFNAHLLDAARVAFQAGKTPDAATADIVARPEFSAHSAARIRAAVTVIYAELKE